VKIIKRSFLSIISSKRLNYSFLIIGALHGLIYVFLMPPWQHYDEPGHFEYVWMIANSSTISERGTYSNVVRLKILESMKEHNFFNSPPLQEVAKYADQIDPVWIGVPQVGDPPLYYWIVALPVRLLLNQPIEIQLYAGRLVSLLLWLGVLFISWLFAKEVSPINHSFRWMLPNSLALLPAFAEHSTALNNDIAATFIYSLIIFFGTRLIKNGVSFGNITILILLMIASYFTKASVWLAVLVVPLAIFIALLRNRRGGIVIGLLALVAIGGTFTLFEFKDVALWFRDTTQLQPTKAETKFGTALHIIDNDPTRSNSVMQDILPPSHDSLFGNTVTVGVWMWSEENIVAYPPSILVINDQYQREFLRPELVSVGTNPALNTIVYRIPQTYKHLYVILEPFINHDGVGIMYYQNPFIVQGNCSGDIIVANNLVSCSGMQHSNLIRNSDAQEIWPKFRSNIINIMNKVDYRIGEAASAVIYSLDTRATFWYTKRSTVNIFRSFWGKFGWGHIQWVGQKPYILPLVFTIIGAVLGVYAFLRYVPGNKTLLWIWFSVAIFCNYFYCWFTGISMQSFFLAPNYPDVRYMYPSVIILMGILASGWSLVINSVSGKFQSLGLSLYFLFFIYLDILSIFSILNYYSNGKL